MDPSQRLKNTKVYLPIAYGSVAWLITKKADNDSCTHNWTLYVRSPHGHDLSPALEKVIFTLHASFNQPVREVLQHPFEVTEKGWGEFEAVIDIQFKDPNERGIELRHFVKLFHGNVPGAPITNKTPVVHEYYDELVFTDPTVGFYQLLQSIAQIKIPHHTLTECFPLYSDVEDAKKIQAAHEFVQDQLRVTRDKLIRIESEAGELLQT